MTGEFCIGVVGFGLVEFCPALDSDEQLVRLESITASTQIIRMCAEETQRTGALPSFASSLKCFSVIGTGFWGVIVVYPMSEPDKK